jgi:hypothetical protein
MKPLQFIWDSKTTRLPLLNALPYKGTDCISILQDKAMSLHCKGFLYHRFKSIEAQHAYETFTVCTVPKP